MARLWPAALAAAVLAGAPARVDAQASSATRVIAFRFTPTARTQIAIWMEKSDGTFLATVGLTQAVSVHGIGNRPGATQMNSGYHWPYGRREGVLADLGPPPGRRARRPRTVSAGDLPEPSRGLRVAHLRGLDARRVLLPPVQRETRARMGSTPSAARARSTATRGGSAPPAEPAVIGGVPMDRVVDGVSLYPPPPRFRGLRPQRRRLSLHGRLGLVQRSPRRGDLRGPGPRRHARHRRSHHGDARRRPRAGGDVLDAGRVGREGITSPGWR